MEIHRGRLLDHVQLVVADIQASKRFYRAVFEALGVPIGGEGEDHLWADELYVSTAKSPAANGAVPRMPPISFSFVLPVTVSATPATRKRLDFTMM